MLAALELGTHEMTEVFGVGLHLGTIRASVVAGLVVVALGLWARFTATAGVPGRLQLAWETAVSAVDHRVGGARGAVVVPLSVTLFVFILVANWLHVLPGSSGVIPTPTADLNLTAALALAVVVIVHGSAIRARGLHGYLRHYLWPRWWMAPLNVLQELVRPVTLALRLFGTAFAGALIIALVGELFPPAAAPIPHAAWMVFDLALGAAQAFIFALLSVLYYEAAVDDSAVDQSDLLDEKIHGRPAPALTIMRAGG